MSLNLKEFEDRVYSQHSEDGIIDELVRRVDPMRYFAEFGCESGENNTRLLAERGWRGKQIEGREDCWQDLVRLNSPHRQRVHAVCDFVTLDNIEEIFASVPLHFGFLCVDVDGNDIHLAREIMRIRRPSIVCVEVNHQKDPEKPYSRPYSDFAAWDGISQEYGSSLFSMREMAALLHYSWVGSDSTGVNAFFVHDRHADALR